jgi:hypothetical protein
MCIVYFRFLDTLNGNKRVPKLICYLFLYKCKFDLFLPKYYKKIDLMYDLNLSLWQSNETNSGYQPWKSVKNGQRFLAICLSQSSGSSVIRSWWWQHKHTSDPDVGDVSTHQILMMRTAAYITSWWWGHQHTSHPDDGDISTHHILMMGTSAHIWFWWWGQRYPTQRLSHLTNWHGWEPEKILLVLCYNYLLILSAFVQSSLGRGLPYQWNAIVIRNQR